MSDSAETASFETPAGAADQPSAAGTDQPSAAATDQPSWSAPAQESAVGIAAERPELVVGAAFAGGLVLAMILKRLAG